MRPCRTARGTVKGGGKNGGGKGKGTFTGKCWSCGGEGHRADQCPNPSEAEKQRRAAKGLGRGGKGGAPVNTVEEPAEVKEDDGWGFTLGSLVAEEPSRGEVPSPPKPSISLSNRWRVLQSPDDETPADADDDREFPPLAQSATADGVPERSATADGSVGCETGCA